MKARLVILLNVKAIRMAVLLFAAMLGVIVFSVESLVMETPSKEALVIGGATGLLVFMAALSLLEWAGMQRSAAEAKLRDESELIQQQTMRVTSDGTRGSFDRRVRPHGRPVDGCKPRAHCNAR